MWRCMGGAKPTAPPPPRPSSPKSAPDIAIFGIADRMLSNAEPVTLAGRRQHSGSGLRLCGLHDAELIPHTASGREQAWV
jgi:hypothetical protein